MQWDLVLVEQFWWIDYGFFLGVEWVGCCDVYFGDQCVIYIGVCDESFDCGCYVFDDQVWFFCRCVYVYLLYYCFGEIQQYECYYCWVEVYVY